MNYEDIYLVPQKSLNSRGEVDLKVNLGPIQLELPIISANMNSITGYKMAEAMWDYGGIGALHRAQSINDQADIIETLYNNEKKCIGTIGLTESLEDIHTLWERGLEVLLIDIANAHHPQMNQRINQIKDKFGDELYIIAGNIATKKALNYLIFSGVDMAKVGIGNGSVCITKNQTGHYVPTIPSLIDCNSEPKIIPTIADGGVREVGDIAKALALGSNLVMIGGMLKDCEEALGDGQYWGMASKKGIRKNKYLEGKVIDCEKNIPVKEIVKEIKEGLKSAFSYSGARNLKEFQKKVKIRKRK